MINFIKLNLKLLVVFLRFRIDFLVLNTLQTLYRLQPLKNKLN
jgi:hypothetical protein